MQYSFLIAALTTALVSGTALKDRTAGEPANVGTSLNKRGCFDGGENWGADRNYAYNYATRACEEAFVGTYRPGDIRAICYNLDSTKKVDFALELISKSNRDIAADECYDGLQKEIGGCDNGGSTSYTNWKYTFVAV